MMHGTPVEFSRVVRADAVERGEVVETIEAGTEEREALARRFELEGIEELKATVRLRRSGGEMVRVTGALEALVVQTCVVTLEPVRSTVRDTFEALFAPDALIPEMPDDLEFDASMLEEDVPEPMPNGRIDIGELTAQHLSLALDPYPRCPGVALPPGMAAEEDEVEEESGQDAGRPNPFAALARLKSPQ